MTKTTKGSPSAATRLVYSTDAGRMCPECGEPMAQCRCRENRAHLAAAAATPSDGIVRVSHETKGRKGKGVTLIKGLATNAETLALTARQLKAACGSGGTVKDGVVEIQGDHREVVVAALVKQGKTVKRAGG